MARCLAAGALTTYLLAVLQTTVGSRLAVAGVSPDLLLVWAICIGLVGGPRAGLVAGFAGGVMEGSLLQAAIGALAISKGMAGLGAGLIADRMSREHWLVPVIAGAAMTVASALLFLALSGRADGWARAGQVTGLRTIYHAALVPVSLLIIQRARQAIAGPRSEVA